MVIFTDWFLSPVIPRSTCVLPMSGEDTGLEAVASPMVGYLGKVNERVASLDHCPWCHLKGLAYPLRSYCINTDESIILCTNPECLFPLVSQSLEDVLASLVLVEPTIGNKRKMTQTLEVNEPSICSKRFKELTSDDSYLYKADTHNKSLCNAEEQVDAHFDDPLQQKDTILNESTESCTPVLVLDNGIKTMSTSINIKEELFTENHKVNGEYKSLTKAICLEKSLPDEDFVYTLPAEAIDTSPVVNNSEFLDCKIIHSDPEDTSTETSEQGLVPAPTELFWMNRDNLCWLDSLLMVLVNVKCFRDFKPKKELEQSPVWTLLTGYDEAHAVIQSQQQSDKDGSLKVPCHLLVRIYKDLETLRMSIFNILQPKLHCTLGENETPVFALPLLVKLDSWLESLFQLRFYWDFNCSVCESKSKENVVKTLPTFTNIVPNWHPLRAVHLAPCNNCHRRNQKRTMVLQGVPPVFALHFVEGLPDNNIDFYNFNFNKKHFSISAIIQYKSHIKHFVTWIQKSDGSWLEFDDLKHPHSKSYKTLHVPAQEIHIVFWEEQQHLESRACSPSTTFTESSLSKSINCNETDLEAVTNTLVQSSLTQSSINSQNNFNAEDISEQDTTITPEIDTSIGSTTLLDTFEGLTHSDIITLTLVNVEEDSTKQPLNSTEHNQAEDLKSENVRVESHKFIKDPMPDSSSSIESIEKTSETDCEAAVMSEKDDNMTDDPTFEPYYKKTKKIVKTVACQVKGLKNTPKEKAPGKTIPPTVTSTSSSSASLVSSNIFTANNVPPATQQEQKGWSHLLERSLGHIQNASKMTSKRKPIAQVTRVGAPCSTQQQQKKTVYPKVTPKPILRLEDNAGLPLKAAEMFGAFGSKNVRPISITANSSKTELTKAVPCYSTSLSSDVSSKKTKSSKMPAGLSETEIIRYKLLKKLKAKKKKFAMMDKMLGERSGNASFKPDSTNSFSPNTVSSSTLDDEFLSDLLSPATTITSTLSPDSTDFLEMFATGQEATVGLQMSSNTVVEPSPIAESNNFLEEFISQSVLERPSEMEVDDVLGGLDLFL